MRASGASELRKCLHHDLHILKLLHFLQYFVGTSDTLSSGFIIHINAVSFNYLWYGAINDGEDRQNTIFEKSYVYASECI